jgi:hypothetical protein
MVSIIDRHFPQKPWHRLDFQRQIRASRGSVDASDVGHRGFAYRTGNLAQPRR